MVIVLNLSIFKSFWAKFSEVPAPYWKAHISQQVYVYKLDCMYEIAGLGAYVKSTYIRHGYFWAVGQTYLHTLTYWIY